MDGARQRHQPIGGAGIFGRDVGGVRHIPAFAAQLTPNLDDWIARLDSAFMPGGMGHHGVSVEMPTATGWTTVHLQPSGLPNRLFRNNGDGTFSDITESAGVGVLDSTSQSLHRHRQRRRRGSVGDARRPLLFMNDGKAHFVRPERVSARAPFAGTLTSAAAADYDRDGFVDLYLCAYSFPDRRERGQAVRRRPITMPKTVRPTCCCTTTGMAISSRSPTRRIERAQRPLQLRGDMGRFRRGRLARPARRERLRAQEPLSQSWPGQRAGTLQGRHRQRGRRRLRRRHERRLRRLRQRRAPRHLHRQHVDRGGIARDRAAGVHAAGAAGDPRALPAARAGELTVPQPGDGTFEDVTLKAGAEFGRWAWSSDALDFDNDGFEDLLVVNGMFSAPPAKRTSTSTASSGDR